eukprot:CAMPEP_0167814480 /NCGR_PEP_ID=MMETSP0112_2-20121227/2449_1 /TAXON_ID=91324 /ORGANISM="Lotharella globosa, Strain CCCM811" /LENGTH=462 /DNA_ID=CAMNT_0007713711 /DNA_START=198 /DNA_END=1586 /DNA_ORIENTATION=-
MVGRSVGAVRAVRAVGPRLLVRGEGFGGGRGFGLGFGLRLRRQRGQLVDCVVVADLVDGVEDAVGVLAHGQHKEGLLQLHADVLDGLDGPRGEDRGEHGADGAERGVVREGERVGPEEHQPRRVAREAGRQRRAQHPLARSEHGAQALHLLVELAHVDAVDGADAARDGLAHEREHLDHRVAAVVLDLGHAVEVGDVLAVRVDVAQLGEELGVHAVLEAAVRVVEALDVVVASLSVEVEVEDDGVGFEELEHAGSLAGILQPHHRFTSHVANGVVGVPPEDTALLETPVASVEAEARENANSGRGSPKSGWRDGQHGVGSTRDHDLIVVGKTQRNASRHTKLGKEETLAFEDVDHVADAAVGASVVRPVERREVQVAARAAAVVAQEAVGAEPHGIVGLEHRATFAFSARDPKLRLREVVRVRLERHLGRAGGGRRRRKRLHLLEARLRPRSDGADGGAGGA